MLVDWSWISAVWEWIKVDFWYKLVVLILLIFVPYAAHFWSKISEIRMRFEDFVSANESRIKTFTEAVAREVDETLKNDVEQMEACEGDTPELENDSGRLIPTGEVEMLENKDEGMYLE